MQCPHCGQPIEVGPPNKQATLAERWQNDAREKGVSLGCGTLIIIAIIVAIFSNNGADEDDVRRVRDEVRSLERKIDQLSDELRKRPVVQPSKQ